MVSSMGKKWNIIYCLIDIEFSYTNWKSRKTQHCLYKVIEIILRVSEYELPFPAAFDLSESNNPSDIATPFIVWNINRIKTS